MGGHLEVLQWARQNGCPWDEETWTIAHPLFCRPYLREHGCPTPSVKAAAPPASRVLSDAQRLADELREFGDARCQLDTSS